MFTGSYNQILTYVPRANQDIETTGNVYMVTPSFLDKTTRQFLGDTQSINKLLFSDRLKSFSKIELINGNGSYLANRGLYLIDSSLMCVYCWNRCPVDTKPLNCKETNYEHKLDCCMNVMYDLSFHTTTFRMHATRMCSISWLPNEHNVSSAGFMAFPANVIDVLLKNAFLKDDDDSYVKFICFHCGYVLKPRDLTLVRNGAECEYEKFCEEYTNIINNDDNDDHRITNMLLALQGSKANTQFYKLNSLTYTAIHLLCKFECSFSRARLLYFHQVKRNEDLRDSELKEMLRLYSLRLLDIDSNRKESTIEIDTNCLLCCINKRNVLLLPCKHLICCFECSLKLIKCGMCRTLISDRVNVYY